MPSFSKTDRKPRDQWLGLCVYRARYRNNYAASKLTSYCGHKFDLLRSRDIIGYVTVGSTYPEYPIPKLNPKWIRFSVAETYPFEDAELWNARRRPTPWHNDTLPETKTLLSWRIANH